MRFGDLRVLVSNQSDTWPDVRVACVWLPRLPLRVEVLRQPALDGWPLVLGGGPGERKVVQLCSPEAEAAGIRPGLPLREVVPLCRDALILSPDPVRVAATLEAVLGALRQVSPTVESTPEGALFLDLRGLQPLYGQMAALEQAIRDAVPPLLRPRLGLANGKFAALVAARSAEPSRAHVVPARATARFLAPLPVSYLPLAPEALRRLELLGLATIGDLVQLPFAAVQAQFGPAGARAWRLARGHDDEPVVSRATPPPTRATLRLDDPLASVDALLVALDQLLAQAFARLRDDGAGSADLAAGRSVRQVRLRALLADGSSWERLFTFKEALASRADAQRALKSKLALPNGYPPAPVEELSLELLGLGGEAARQPSLFAAPARQFGHIAEAVRHLRTRYGGQAPLYHAVEVEPWSRIPERRWALVACDL